MRRPETLKVGLSASAMDAKGPNMRRGRLSASVGAAKRHVARLYKAQRAHDKMSVPWMRMGWTI